MNITQRHLAERADVDPSWLSRIETGKVSNPRLKTLGGLAAVFGLKAEGLLARASEYESGVRPPPENRRARPRR